MSDDVPSIDSISTERDRDADDDIVIIEFDDGSDDSGRFGPSFANTQVRVGRNLDPDPEMDGWLDIAVYHGGDYAEPISVLSWAHPDHSMTPQQLVVDKIMPTLLDAHDRRELRNSGLLGKRLAEAFDETNVNAAKLA